MKGPEQAQGGGRFFSGEYKGGKTRPSNKVQRKTKRAGLGCASR